MFNLGSPLNHPTSDAKLTKTREVEKSNMEEPIAMARLAWIASELGSATGFPKRAIIAEALARRRSGALAGGCVLYPPHSTPLLPRDG
jgi:hypothetical protein